MNIQFVNKIPKDFTYVKGMREPIYGDNNKVIGFTFIGNDEVDSGIVVVRGEENQLKKYHMPIYEKVQSWLDKHETRTLKLTMTRRAWKHIEDFSKENVLELEDAIEEAIIAIE